MLGKDQSQGGKANQAGRESLEEVTEMLESLGYREQGARSTEGLVRCRKGGFFPASDHPGIYCRNCEFTLKFLYDEKCQIQKGVSLAILPKNHQFVMPLKVQSQETSGTTVEKIDHHAWDLMQLECPISLMAILGTFEGQEKNLKKIWDRLIYTNRERKKLLLFRHVDSLRKYIAAGAPIPGPKIDFQSIWKSYTDMCPVGSIYRSKRKEEFEQW